MKVINTVGSSSYVPLPSYITVEQGKESDVLVGRLQKQIARLAADGKVRGECRYVDGDTVVEYVLENTLLVRGGYDALGVFVEELEKIDAS